MINNYLDTPGGAPVFAKAGAFIRRAGEDNNPYEMVTYGAELRTGDDGLVYLVPEFIDGVTSVFPVGPDTLTIDEKTGTIEFRAQGVDYTIREFREEDGYWVSALHMPLSVPILEGLVENVRNKNNMAMIPSAGVTTPEEKLFAYAFDDSLYIVGLVYANDMGRWLRVDADWVLLDPNDDTFNNAEVIEIDPEKADEYVDLYDANYVPVSDTEDFEYNEGSSTETPAEPTEK